MEKLDKSEIIIISISQFLGPSDLSVYLSFLDSETEGTVKLCIEGLIRKKALLYSKGKICPVTEFAKYTDLGLLFGALSEEESSKIIKTELLISPLHIAGFLSFMLSNSFPVNENHYYLFLKSGILEKFIPYVDKERGMSMCLLVRRFLLFSGAVTIEDNKYVANVDICKKIVKLSSFELTINILQMVYNIENPDAIYEFFEFFKGICISSKGIERLFKLILLKYNSSLQPEGILDLLNSLGVIYSSNNVFYLNKAFFVKNAESPITCGTDMTLVTDGNSAINENLFLFADILTCDSSSIWIINKSSFFRALNYGLTVKNIKDILNYPYYDDIFAQWEKDYSRLKLYEGTTVQCTPEFDNVISSLDKLKPFLIAKIAPCIFVFKSAYKDIWSEILRRAMDYESLPSIIKDYSGKETSDHKLFSFKKTAFSSADIKKSYRTLNTGIEESLHTIENEDLLFSIFDLGQSEFASGMDYKNKKLLLQKAANNNRILVKIETLQAQYCGQILQLIKAQDGDEFFIIKTLPSGVEKTLSVSSVYKVTSIKLSF